MTSEYFETGYTETPEDDFCYCEEDNRCAPCDAALARYRALGREIAQAEWDAASIMREAA